LREKIKTKWEIESGGNKESKEQREKNHLLVSKAQLLSVVRFPDDASGSSHDVRPSV